MVRIPFDRDRIAISSSQATRLRADARFDLVRADHPRFLRQMPRWLRPLEPRLADVPPGTLYLVLVPKT